MYASGIQGQLLEVTVVGCNKLKDTEWISRQDPYVCLEYGTTKYRTRTCTDGHKNPTFNEKFVFPLIEGLREMKVLVWNSNTMTYDDFIGSGKVILQKAIAEGYDDTAWGLQTKRGRHAGEVKLIIHFPNARKAGHSSAPTAPPHMGYSHAQVPAYSVPPPAAAVSYPPPPAVSYSYPPPPAVAASYPPPPATSYPPSPYPSYPAYPPSQYPPQPAPYPPSGYPPTSQYPPPGPFHGSYPPQY